MYDKQMIGFEETYGAIGVSGASVYTVDEQLVRVGLDYMKSMLWPSK